MINFGLYKNLLTNGSGFFRAIVLPQRTYNLEDVIDRMVEQGTTLTRQDIMAVLDLFFSTIVRLILEGNNVLTPWSTWGRRSKATLTASMTRLIPAATGSSRGSMPTSSSGASSRRARGCSSKRPTGPCPSRRSTSTPTMATATTC